MSPQAALKILQRMFDGIDPLTGEILPEDHLLNQPEVVRALQAGIHALSELEALDAPIFRPDSAMVNRNGRVNAGRSWTEADVKWLSQLYQAGESIDQICQKLQRRERGVRRKLQELGLLSYDKADCIPGLENAGLPWDEKQEEKLQKMFHANASIHSIAKEMKRTRGAITARLKKLGLIDD